MSIGVFDSGIGGLTVLKEIRKVLPDEKYIILEIRQEFRMVKRQKS